MAPTKAGRQMGLARQTINSIEKGRFQQIADVFIQTCPRSPTYLNNGVLAASSVPGGLNRIDPKRRRAFLCFAGRADVGGTSWRQITLAATNSVLFIT
ncbi:MAG: hypothetical protein WCA00_11350 [Candidatus Acidiferrales bacterium]